MCTYWLTQNLSLSLSVDCVYTERKFWRDSAFVLSRLFFAVSITLCLLYSYVTQLLYWFSVALTSRHEAYQSSRDHLVPFSHSSMMTFHSDMLFFINNESEKWFFDVIIWNIIILLWFCLRTVLNIDLLILAAVTRVCGSYGYMRLDWELRAVFCMMYWVLSFSHRAWLVWVIVQATGGQGISSLPLPLSLSVLPHHNRWSGSIPAR